MSITSILVFCAGLLGAGYLPRLPTFGWVCLLLVPLLLCWWSRYRRYFFLPGVTAAGLAWGIAAGHLLLLGNLPSERGGEDFIARGEIIGLPQSDTRRHRFLMRIDQLEPLNGKALATVPRRVQVSWYSGSKPASGERWQLRLRLKPPRGFVNPGGFDYQAWLLRQGVDAAGYVRKDQNNGRIEAGGAGVGVWRQNLREWLLETSTSERRDLLLALLIGDRSLIGPGQWQQLQQTGTNHLVAISGLHVGFVALLGFGLGAALGRLGNLVWHWLPASLPAHLCAAFCAFGYSALAGFSLPTQRALIMVLVFQWTWLHRRSISPWRGLVLALLGVALLDPLASFDPGFWLSFGAVAVLLLAFSGRYPVRRPRWGGRLLRAQWVVFVGLLLPLGLLMHISTPLAPLANLVAIPLVTFVVVPGLLVAAALHKIFPWLSDLALMVAEQGIGALALWLNALVALGGSLFRPVLTFSPAALILAFLAVGLIFLPRGIAVRWLGYPTLLLALLLPARSIPPLSVSFLDVGQGLAVVVQTPNHSLVYDTGPSYSERMEAGGAILAPYLRRQGVTRLDRVVVSHGHGDHAGGLAGLLSQLPVERILSGEDLTQAPFGADVQDCHDESPWRWDGVDFRFLVATGVDSASGNNRSCVLAIEYRDERVLLTGDIEREVEWRLLGQGQLPGPLSVLQVPHHGSRSSSTREFLEHTQPRYAVVSAGYGSAHGHPHPDVLERYRRQGTLVWNTAESGALEFLWQAPGQPMVRSMRNYRRRYWYD